MGHELLDGRGRTYSNFVRMLSCVVVFVITYMLILPAIAIDRDTAAEQGGINLPAVFEEPGDVRDPSGNDGSGLDNADISENSVDSEKEDVEADASAGIIDPDTENENDTSDAGDANTASNDIVSLIYEGNGYTVTVTDKNEILPESVHVEAEEILRDSKKQTLVYDDYVARTEEALGWEEGSATYIRLFDIKIADENGNKFDIPAPVDVRIELAPANNDSTDSKKAAEEAKAVKEAFSDCNTQVVHFADDADEPDVVQNVDIDAEDGIVTFEAEGFSAYAIVAAPEEAELDITRISSLDELKGMAAEGTGLYIGNPGGYYLTSGITIIKGTRTGITKTKPPQSYPPENAVRYYFEQISGTDNQFYIYCIDGGNKKYIQNTGNNSLNLTDEAGRTAFTASDLGNGVWTLNNGSWYINMQGGVNGASFAAYNNAADDNNKLNILIYNAPESDPYGFDGKSYGLMSWDDGVFGKAVMAEAAGSGALAVKPLTVMTEKNDQSDKLFVPSDSDITMWTFEWIEGTTSYYLRNEEGMYLSIGTGGASLKDTPDSSCIINPIPGSGTHAGEIDLVSGGKSLTYSGKTDTGFNTSGPAGSEWLYLVDKSELTSDYFRTYSASKVSVSDPAVTDGSKIIVYMNIWNDTTKKYETYAIDSDGSLIRCYLDGDHIEWIGNGFNSLLWNFNEYYKTGTTEPNYYYDLYNQYSQKYLAPQLKDGQVLSDNPIGINLDGRRNGQYYSEIVAWDDAHYAYTGLKVEDGRVVACPIAEADDFYFAIMQDPDPDDELHTVRTVDHVRNGITMKIIDLESREQMSNFLGSDDDKHLTEATQGLLSTNLDSNGYPTAKGGSLGNLYSGAREVNHLFIKSTYEGTGYYEYDSAQNYATLKGDEFVVYKEIGTHDESSRVTLKHGQFFPFNDIRAGEFARNNSRNLYEAAVNRSTGKPDPLPDTDPRKNERLYLLTEKGKKPNYQFALELEAGFVQTPGGLDAWGHDIIYEFTGDDDFWLYVDGELLIDLGGIHSAIPGSVNYSTGEVNVNGKQTTIKALFTENYQKRGMSESEINSKLSQIFKEGTSVFKDNTPHTMRIFYMERGAGASNLHMRFNLASVRPGTVELTKKLSGVDSTESSFAEFPYQIWYTKQETVPGSDNAGSAPQNAGVIDEEQFEADKQLVPAPENGQYDSTEKGPKVFYKGTNNPVKSRKTLTIDGVTYQEVFLLKPGETAEIQFPDGEYIYKIIECGVNTDIYDSVKANDTEITGTGTAGHNNYKDFSTEIEDIRVRPLVTYDNEVNPDALRTLTITKKLFREDGSTPITSAEDSTPFNFRLYLGTEYDDSDKVALADLHTYHVRAENGSYCKWDKDSRSFVSLGADKTDYSQLTAAEKKSASFTTSMNGAISNIPTGYTVEIREILAGTKYKVEERDSEIPDGYSLQKYETTDVEGERSSQASDIDPVSGIIAANKDPHIDVCNLKGWGLRVNKIWSDKDYMSDREPTYFAVFTKGNSNNGHGNGDGNIHLVEGTVRQLKYGADPQTLYWYFDHLAEGKGIDDYIIREVRLTGDGWTVNEDGTVTDITSSNVHSIHQHGKVTLSGRQKGEISDSRFEYEVQYKTGDVSSESNVRVDTATNYRPGIILKKTDWDGATPLAGAQFELKSSDGRLIGMFTSDDEGFITEAYLADDKPYTLTEIKAPQGYKGLDAPMTITSHRNVDQTDITVTGVEDESYTINEQADPPVITVKNRTYTFRAVKTDRDTGDPVSGVHFQLHREITVDGVTSFDFNPMEGYEDLVSGSDGVITGIDNILPAGTYGLKEKAATAGYEKLEQYIRFTVSPTGEISLGGGVPEGVAIAEKSAPDGSYHYELTIPNVKIAETRKVSVWKTDSGYNAITTGAEFALYRAEDYDDETEEIIGQAVPLTSGITGDDGILSLGTLETGEYRLVERKAPDGYVRAKGAIRIMVNDNGVTAMQSGNIADVNTENDGTGHWVSGQDEGTWQVRVWNNPGVELPHAGGMGTTLFYVLGSILTVFSAVAMIARRRLYRR